MIVQPSFTETAQSNSLGKLTSEETPPVALLLSAINALAIRLRQRGRPAPNSTADLPGAEQAVLEIIDRVGAVTVPQIARERSTSRQNIQILVDRLVVQGRVELASNPAHKRSALVRLTHEGKSLLDAGMSSQKQLLDELGSSLSRSEISMTVTVLRRICSRLSGETDPGRNLARTSDSNFRDKPERTEPLVDVQPAMEEFPINLL